MFKRQMLFAAVLSLLAFMVASCGTSEITPSANTSSSTVPPLPAPSPTSQDLVAPLLGLWEWRDEQDGSSRTLDFGDSGTVIIETELHLYEVVDETTMVIHGETLQYRLAENSLQLIDEHYGGTETSYLARTYFRLNAVPDLADAIVGLWTPVDEDGAALVDYENFDFVRSGLLIYGLVEYAPYKVLTDNSIGGLYVSSESGELIDSDDLDFVLQVTEVTGNRLVLRYDGSDFVFTRIEGHSRLAERIVGRWVGQWGNEQEVTADGRFVGYRGYEARYSVLSDTTIRIQFEDGGEEYINVIRLDDDTFTYGRFRTAFDCCSEGADEYQVLTRIGR